MKRNACCWLVMLFLSLLARIIWLWFKRGLKPVNGLLSGDQVKPVLLNSKLPVDVLGKIWDISDIDQDGSLDRDEFSVAMHLVYRALDGEVVPAILPLILVPPSKRNIPTMHVTMPSVNATMPLVPQLSGGGGRSASPPTEEQQWAAPPTDKLKYDQMFLQFNPDQNGLVSGVTIKNVLKASGLPQNMLAHIWNLCDKNNTGYLNSEQFSFAMQLISMAKAGKELPQPVEMVAPSSLPGKASSDLSQISLESSSSDFSAIKELDQITTEIEALGKEKASLQKEINETEEAIRKRKTEIENLQCELQKGNKGIDILNQQKSKSQSQLDSLDSEKNKYEEEYKEIQIKLEDEKQVLNQLKSQYKSQQESFKGQEVELQQARKELDVVRKEESELEQEVEKNKNELDRLKEKVSRTKSETSQVQLKIDKLAEENNSLKEEIQQYTTMSNNTHMQNGSNHLSEMNENFETRFKDMDQVSARATAGSSPVSSISGFSGSGCVGDDDDNDDFKDTDPFKSKDDPFGGNESENIDPFNSDDPFKSDPFKTVSFADDPFSGDPFQDNDPFKSDPFKQIPGNAENKSSKNEEIPVASGSDPFSSLDPFGSGAFVSNSTGKSAFSSGKPKSIESNSSDPFSSGNLYNSHSITDKSTTPDSERSSPKPAINDPFTNDPFASGDPFASPLQEDPFSSTSTATIEDPFSPQNTSNDPFLSTSVANDPFSSSSVSTPSNDPFSPSVSTAPSDPFSSSAAADPFSTPVSLADDPFASTVTAPNADPFSSSNVNTDSSDTWFAFGDVSFTNTSKSKEPDKAPATNNREDSQLEWAKRESEREEAERQKRLKELADREEMEMAYALKQSVESSSEA